MDTTISTYCSKSVPPSDLESPEHLGGEGSTDTIFSGAATKIADVVMSSLRSEIIIPERLASIDRATHCLDATLYVQFGIGRLSS